jgi:hypothetical protein
MFSQVPVLKALVDTALYVVPPSPSSSPSPRPKGPALTGGAIAAIVIFSLVGLGIMVAVVRMLGARLHLQSREASTCAVCKNGREPLAPHSLCLPQSLIATRNNRGFRRGVHRARSLVVEHKSPIRALAVVSCCTHHHSRTLHASATHASKVAPSLRT